jgi:hypothetical protein
MVEMAGFEVNDPLVTITKRMLWREQEKLRNAKAEIFRLKKELIEMGIELSPDEMMDE